jgi:hypothetical protein
MFVREWLEVELFWGSVLRDQKGINRSGKHWVLHTGNDAAGKPRCCSCFSLTAPKQAILTGTDVLVQNSWLDVT